MKQQIFAILGILCLGCAPQLDADHPGWKHPDCHSCHDDAHNLDKHPAECAECHGENGAPAGHTDGDCTQCHADTIADHGPSERFTVPDDCLGCHEY